jgi:hypothetical protein
VFCRATSLLPQETTTEDCLKRDGSVRKHRTAPKHQRSGGPYGIYT